MPIHTPGVRDRHGKSSSGGREAVATLSLTAMVDMFTVLTIFLLQNYKDTGEIIKMRKDVDLPKATQIRELKPAQIVIIAKDMIFVNEDEVVRRSVVENSKSWSITKLKNKLKYELAVAEAEYKKGLKKRIKNVVNKVQEKEREEANLRKVTLQADKDVDFLTIKKVMYTITEAGSSEIHFAVITSDTDKFKKPEELEDSADI